VLDLAQPDAHAGSLLDHCRTEPDPQWWTGRTLTHDVPSSNDHSADSNTGAPRLSTPAWEIGHQSVAPVDDDDMDAVAS
jgi:hypothetical protein